MSHLVAISQPVFTHERAIQMAERLSPVPWAFISTPELWHVHAVEGRERRDDMLIPWFMDLERGAAGYMGGISGLDDANNVNEELQIRFVLQVNTSLVQRSGDVSVPPLFQAALEEFGKRLGCYATWEPKGYGGSLITMSNLLKSFAADEKPPKLLGKTSPREFAALSRECDDTLDALAIHLESWLTGCVDPAAVDAHLAAYPAGVLFTPKVKYNWFLSEVDLLN